MNHQNNLSQNGGGIIIKSKMGFNDKDKRKIKCYHCQATGHKKSECWIRNPSLKLVPKGKKVGKVETFSVNKSTASEGPRYKLQVEIKGKRYMVRIDNGAMSTLFPEELVLFNEEEIDASRKTPLMNASGGKILSKGRINVDVSFLGRNGKRIINVVGDVVRGTAIGSNILIGSNVLDSFD
uniref:CCHC-type domain-containing protein n=1 Tax=Strongyloides venezuelensis TaxID=75913 RepID=A0A0K0FX08_STRVS